MRSLEEELLVAHMRLMSDPCITSYTFDNGVEQRSSSSPWVERDHKAPLDVAIADAVQRKADAFKTARD